MERSLAEVAAEAAARCAQNGRSCGWNGKGAHAAHHAGLIVAEACSLRARRLVLKLVEARP